MYRLALLALPLLLAACVTQSATPIRAPIPTPVAATPGDHEMPGRYAVFVDTSRLDAALPARTPCPEQALAAAGPFRTAVAKALATRIETPELVDGPLSGAGLAAGAYLGLVTVRVADLQLADASGALARKARLGLQVQVTGPNGPGPQTRLTGAAPIGPSASCETRAQVAGVALTRAMEGALTKLPVVVQDLTYLTAAGL